MSRTTALDRDQWFFLSKCSIIVVLLMFTSVLSKAQPYTVKGRIAKTTDSMPGADLLAIDAQTGILIKAYAVENSDFEIKEIANTEFILKIICPGHSDTNIVVSNPNHSGLIDIGTISLSKVLQLKEVVFTSATPLFQRTNEGSRINVENTMLAACAGTAELLGKSPGLSVSGSKVSIFGKGEALIYLGGRQITYERLLSIPVSQVKSIDIITNPSAKYDARGRAVVNITLRKNTNEGISGSISQNSTKGKYFQSNSNVSLTYRWGKVSLYGDYTLSLGKDWNENNYGVVYDLPQGVYKTNSYYQEHTRSTNVSGYRLGLGYDIDAKTDVSVQFDGLYNLFNLAVENDANNYNPSGTNTNIKIFNNGRTVNENYSGNINFNRKLDTSGSTLFFGAQYNNFENRLYDQLKERITYPGNTVGNNMRINDGNNRISLFIAQVDFSKVLNNSYKLEFGGKYSRVTNESRIKFLSKGENEILWQENELIANSFLYQEDVPAIYMMFSGKSGKVDYNAGVRGELSYVNGYSRKLGREVFDTTYFNLFPNARAAYAISSQWSTALSYSYRINRPLYQDIDPFVWYIDSLTSIQGNSGLKPEFINSLEWSLIYKSFVLKLGYASTNSAIRSIARTGNSGPNSVIFAKANLKRYTQYTASVEIPIEKKHFNSYTTIAYNLNEIDVSGTDYILRPITPQLYIYMYNQVILTGICNIDLSGEYYGTCADGITVKKEPYYYVSLGASKTVLNKKLSLQIIWNDVFKTARNVGDRNFGLINNYFSQRFNTNFFRITLLYKFGGRSVGSYKNKSVNSVEYGRIRK